MTLSQIFHKICKTFVPLATSRNAFLEEFIRDLYYFGSFCWACIEGSDDWKDYPDDEPRQRTKFELRKVHEAKGGLYFAPVLILEVDFIPAADSLEGKPEVVLVHLLPYTETYRLWDGGDGNHILVKIGHDYDFQKGHYFPAIYSPEKFWVDGWRENEPLYELVEIDDAAFVLHEVTCPSSSRKQNA